MPRIWNHYCAFISLPVDHCRDHRCGVAGVRELQWGWHWLLLGQSKGSSVTTVSPSICLPAVAMCVASLHRAWSALLCPLPSSCHVWEIMSVQIFVWLLTFFFFRKGWSLRGGGKASYEVNSLEITRQNKWLVLHYTQECCQNNPFSYPASQWRKTASEWNLRSGGNKGHHIPLMRKTESASSSPRSCELLSTIKWSLYFSDTSLPWCHADKRLLHAPFSKKSHLPNNSGTVLVIRFWILETIFLMVTSIFNVNRLMLCSNGSSLSPFVHQKIQMGFFFLFSNGKRKTLPLNSLTVEGKWL